MPPKAKCTRQQIIEAAFSIVREAGMEALTARSLAKRLGTSTAPIFTVFETLEAVQNEVMRRAKELYTEYLRAGLRQTPAFKGAGLQFIQFAREEPELFRLLCMTGNGSQELTHFLPEHDDNAPVVLDAAMRSYGLDEEKARKLYNHLSVYTYGLAVLFAQKCCMFSMEDISRMLTEVFTALIRKIAEE